MIIGRLSESMPADTRRLILYPLLRPLLLFWGPKGRQQPSCSSLPSAAAAAASKNNPPSNTNKKSPSRKPSSSPPPVPAEEAAAAIAGRRGAGTAAVAAARGGANRGGSSVGSGIGRDEIVSSEERLDRCLEDLEKLLTAAPAPAALLGLLSQMGVAVPLFRLHCFCTT